MTRTKSCIRRRWVGGFWIKFHRLCWNIARFQLLYGESERCNISYVSIDSHSFSLRSRLSSHPSSSSVEIETLKLSFRFQPFDPIAWQSHICLLQPIYFLVIYCLILTRLYQPNASTVFTVSILSLSYTQTNQTFPVLV